jgi:hypothetical protein
MTAVYPYQKSPRCSATSKRTRKPCMAPAVNGWTVCRFHGAPGWWAERQTQRNVSPRAFHERSGDRAAVASTISPPMRPAAGQGTRCHSAFMRSFPFPLEPLPVDLTHHAGVIGAPFAQRTIHVRWNGKNRALEEKIGRLASGLKADITV